MFEPNPPVQISIPQKRAMIVSEWLHEYRQMFGPLAESHPVEILIEEFNRPFKK